MAAADTPLGEDSARTSLEQSHDQHITMRYLQQHVVPFEGSDVRQMIDNSDHPDDIGEADACRDPHDGRVLDTEQEVAQMSRCNQDTQFDLETQCLEHNRIHDDGCQQRYTHGYQDHADVHSHVDRDIHCQDAVSLPRDELKAFHRTDHTGYDQDRQDRLQDIGQAHYGYRADEQERMHDAPELGPWPVDDGGKKKKKKKKTSSTRKERGGILNAADTQHGSIGHNEAHSQQQHVHNNSGIAHPAKQPPDVIDKSVSQLQHETQAASMPPPSFRGLLDRSSRPSIGEYWQPQPLYLQSISRQQTLVRELAPATRREPSDGPAAQPVAVPTKKRRRQENSSDCITAEDAIMTVHREFKKKQDTEAELRAQIESLWAQLHEKDRERQALEDRIQALQQEIECLNVLNGKQEDKINSLTAKAGRFKIFVDGLGNDFDLLKRDANAQHLKSDKLVREAKEQQELQSSILQELSSCAEKATQLKNDALKTCQDAKAQLSTAALQHSQLENELQRTENQLAEEKNLRLQLQAQLSAATHDSEAAVRQLKVDNDAVLDKLYEMHGTMEDWNELHGVSETLEKINTAVQNLIAQQTASPQDLTAVKELIESLSTNLVRPTSNSEDLEQQKIAIESCLAESLGSLKADLCKQDQLIADNATHLQEVARLREHLRIVQDREAQCDGELTKMQDKIDELKQQHNNMQLEIVELQTIAGAEAEVKKAAEQSAQSAVKEAEASLQSARTELESFKTTNVALQEQVGRLEERLGDVRAGYTRSPDQEALDKAFEEGRQAAIAHVDADNDEKKAELANERQRCTSENMRLTRNLKDAQSALEAERSKTSADISELQAKLKDAEHDAINAEQLQALESQLTAEKIMSTQLRSDVAQLNQQISNARSATEEHNSGMKMLKASCSEEIKRVQDSATKQIEALQEQLRESKEAHQELIASQQKFSEGVERTWHTEQAKHVEALDAATAAVKRAEAERNEAQAKVTELQQQLAKATERPGSRIIVPKIGTDTTPAAAQPAQPTKPKKKFDRNAQSEVADKAIPAPGMLCQPSARPASGEEQSRRPAVVEQSQQGILGATEVPHMSSSPRSFDSFGQVWPTNTLASSQSQLQSQVQSQLPDAVRETQFGDVPSFAAFNAGHSSMPAPGATQVLSDKNAGRIATDQGIGTAPQNVVKDAFEIYQDPEEDVFANTQNAYDYLEESIPNNMNKYKFQRAMPPPNSSSKLVRTGSDVSLHSRGSQSRDASLEKVCNAKAKHHKTPEPSKAQAAGGYAALSSSPGFVATSQPTFSQNVYHSDSAKKRRYCLSQSGQLENQNVTPPKRQAEAKIAYGYEEERRKRVKPPGANDKLQSSQDASQPSVQPSGARAGAGERAQLMSDLSITRGKKARGAARASRMQSFSSQPLQSGGTSKKLSKNDQMSARFKQELAKGGRR